MTARAGRGGRPAGGGAHLRHQPGQRELDLVRGRGPGAGPGHPPAVAAGRAGPGQHPLCPRQVTWW